jgi:beta-lactamase class A
VKKKVIVFILAGTFVSAWIFLAASRKSSADYSQRLAEFERISAALGARADIVSFYYKDLSDNFEYYHRPDDPYPSASLVKLPVMACVMAAVEENRLPPDLSIVYRSRHRVGGSGSLRYSRYGRRVGLDELTYRMIVESDNVATNMICDTLGLGYINEKMLGWGMDVTDMKRWVLDLRRRNQGVENYTTSREMGMLLEKIYRGQLVSRRASMQMLEIMKNQHYRNRIPRYLPPGVVVANKTGLMRNVVHDAGIIYSTDGDYVLCVLTRDIPSKTAARLIGEISHLIYDVHASQKDTGAAKKDVSTVRLPS